jgi:hypothetical protein
VSANRYVITFLDGWQCGARFYFCGTKLVLHRINMSDFPQFNNAKLMIAASVRHCRFTIEELPVGQIIVDEFGNIRSIDRSTETVLAFGNIRGKHMSELLVDAEKQFPKKLSPQNCGDLGEMAFRAKDETLIPARLVCIPGSHPQTFLLSVVF